MIVNLLLAQIHVAECMKYITGNFKEIDYNFKPYFTALRHLK